MDKQREDMWVKTGAQLQAGRKMLAALRHMHESLELCHQYGFEDEFKVVKAAIKTAEKAGITTGDE